MKSIFWIAFLAFAAWCGFSDEGKIFTVKMTSAVGLTPPVLELDFEQLEPGMKKEAVLAMYPNIDFYCYEETRVPEFGDSGCNNNIALFNGMRAFNIALFFKKGSLNVVRVALQPESHAAAVTWLDAQYQRTDIKAEGSFTGGKKYPITVWKTPGKNYVMSSRDETDVGEAIVLWTDSIAGFEF